MVQAEPEEDEEDRNLQVEGIKIIWSADIERLGRMYGRMFIDYVKGFFGPRFVVGFESVSC
jgi:hypothetical protein